MAEAAIDRNRVRLIPPGSRRQIARAFGEAMTHFHFAVDLADTPNLDNAAAHAQLEAAIRDAME